MKGFKTAFKVCDRLKRYERFYEPYFFDQKRLKRRSKKGGKNGAFFKK